MLHKPDISRVSDRRNEMMLLKPQFRTIIYIAMIWAISDLGYYFLLPQLGVTPEYNESSLAIALYYSYWVGFCIVLFWPLYATWQLQSRWQPFENRLVSVSIWTVFFLGAVAFVGYVMPALPPFVAPKGKVPPELPLADMWYFSPKSVDILFQQLLVASLVLSLAALETSLVRISIACAALFGASHLLLLFGGAPVGYVLRFTIAASVFGFIFTYLMLRVRNGLAYSYIAHWSFYAGVIVLSRAAF